MIRFMQTSVRGRGVVIELNEYGVDCLHEALAALACPWKSNEVQMLEGALKGCIARWADSGGEKP